MLARLPPAVIALLLQIVAVALTWLGVSGSGMRVTPLLFAVLCGGLAAGFSYFAGLARWWLLIQLLFVPALVLMLAQAFPPEWFLLAFVLMLVIYWSTFRTQVPLYLSSQKVWCALETLLPAEKKSARFNFIDLGSGLGGVLTHLARARPDGAYTGVESAPLPFLWSWLRIRFGRFKNCEVQWGDLWACDLSRYDVVFAYLSPVPMAQLWHKARAEMRPGTVFISSTFAVPEQAAHQSLAVDDLHHSTLLIWRM